MADSKKYNGSTWEHSLRKLTTATDTITTLPADIYADGNNATVGISGNMSQTGTPTPQNPIQPQECGDLETVGEKAGQYKIPISSANTTTPVYLGEVESTRKIRKYEFTGNEDTRLYAGAGLLGFELNIADMLTNSRTLGVSTHFKPQITGSGMTTDGITFGANNKTVYITLSQTTINTYNLSDISTIRSWLSAQYAAGTPVTVWYILATPATGIVNEPLRKIGDYADTVSGITIPTTTGKDTVDVDTTLKPSEVSLNYTGWHDATVEEWDGSQWQ